MKTHISCFLLFAFMVGFVEAADELSAVQYSNLGDRVKIIGHFGIPIGQYIIIEGKRSKTDNLATTSNTLSVEKLNGKTLKIPADIKLDDIDSLNEGVVYVLKGYETGGMIGIPPPNEIARRQGGQMEFGLRFQVSFKIVESVTPGNLKLKTL